MSWYYAEGNQQKGPVTESELDRLFQTGQINGATLIWKEGMANWQPFASVRQPQGAGGGSPGLSEGSVVCSQCGNIFSQNEIIRYGDKAVCATCKPVFVQKLREGATLSSTDFEYAGFWIRFGAKFVDGIIQQVVNGIFGFILGVAGAAAIREGGEPNLAFIGLTYFISITIHVLYNTIFIGAYGATPGKMICKIRVVNADGSKVSYGKACGRSFAEFISSFTCLIGYLMAAFDDEKRTLHDRICDTRVIRN